MQRPNLPTFLKLRSNSTGDFPISKYTGNAPLDRRNARGLTLYACAGGLRRSIFPLFPTLNGEWLARRVRSRLRPAPCLSVDTLVASY